MAVDTGHPLPPRGTLNSPETQEYSIPISNLFHMSEYVEHKKKVKLKKNYSLFTNGIKPLVGS